jgi:hypothetical protein
MSRTAEQSASKFPEVTLVFWIIKIVATTLGETGGFLMRLPASTKLRPRARPRRWGEPRRRPTRAERRQAHPELLFFDTFTKSMATSGRDVGAVFRSGDVCPVLQLADEEAQIVEHPGLWASPQSAICGSTIAFKLRNSGQVAIDSVMTVPSSSTKAAARYNGPPSAAEKPPRSTCSVGTVIPFSARNTRTRRGFGARPPS